MFTIEQKPVPNHGTRDKHKPIAIVNHITIGSRGSVINSFSRPGGNSSHFLVCRDGAILQFVDLTRRAHTNGYVRSPKSPLVKQMGAVNPNYYTATIEHEGYDDHGGDGTLTDVQFFASCWLHKWIQKEVERLYGVRIALNSHQVIAHHQVDSKKGTCPGINFPWTRLYAELAIADSMTLEEYAEHLEFLQSPGAIAADAFKFLNRMKQLKANRAKFPVEADRKILLLSPVAEAMGVTDAVTADSILAVVEEIEANGIEGGKWKQDYFSRLSIGIQQAKNVGLIA